MAVTGAPAEFHEEDIANANISSVGESLIIMSHW